jgi:hypothetical protein
MEEEEEEAAAVCCCDTDDATKDPKLNVKLINNGTLFQSVGIFTCRN